MISAIEFRRPWFEKSVPYLAQAVAGLMRSSNRSFTTRYWATVSQKLQFLSCASKQYLKGALSPLYTLLFHLHNLSFFILFPPSGILLVPNHLPSVLYLATMTDPRTNSLLLFVMLQCTAMYIELLEIPCDPLGQLIGPAIERLSNTCCRILQSIPSHILIQPVLNLVSCDGKLERATMQVPLYANAIRTCRLCFRVGSSVDSYLQHMEMWTNLAGDIWYCDKGHSTTNFVDGKQTHGADRASEPRLLRIIKNGVPRAIDFDEPPYSGSIFITDKDSSRIIAWVESVGFLQPGLNFLDPTSQAAFQKVVEDLLNALVDLQRVYFRETVQQDPIQRPREPQNDDLSYWCALGRCLVVHRVTHRLEKFDKLMIRTIRNKVVDTQFVNRLRKQLRYIEIAVRDARKLLVHSFLGPSHPPHHVGVASGRANGQLVSKDEIIRVFDLLKEQAKSLDERSRSLDDKSKAFDEQAELLQESLGLHEKLAKVGAMAVRETQNAVMKHVTEGVKKGDFTTVNEFLKWEREVYDKAMEIRVERTYSRVPSTVYDKILNEDERAQQQRSEHLDRALRTKEKEYQETSCLLDSALETKQRYHHELSAHMIESLKESNIQIKIKEDQLRSFERVLAETRKRTKVCCFGPLSVFPCSPMNDGSPSAQPTTLPDLTRAEERHETSGNRSIHFDKTDAEELSDEGIGSCSGSCRESEAADFRDFIKVEPSPALSSNAELIDYGEQDSDVYYLSEDQV